MADDSSAAAPEAIAATQAETQSVASFPPATIAMGDENPPEDWSPPQVNEQGFAIDGHGLPLNLRLRAAALAEAGKDEDPEGSVAPEHITAAADRLAAYDKAFPKATATTKIVDLEKMAKAQGLDISTAANNEERAAMINAARPSRV